MHYPPSHLVVNKGSFFRRHMEWHRFGLSAGHLHIKTAFSFPRSCQHSRVNFYFVDIHFLPRIPGIGMVDDLRWTVSLRSDLHVPFFFFFFIFIFPL